ncbi:MAG: M67 family metallopeptidase [Spirulinaceae cyanobacterium]
MLNISSEHLEKIRKQGESTYPEECCGLLIGTLQDSKKIVRNILPQKNSWGEDNSFPGENSQFDKRRRFSIAPQALLKAQKEARKLNLAIIGIYHSHPNYPAQPSEFDRAIAWSEYSYIIVSVTEGKSGDLFSWVLDDEGKFQREEILQTIETG